MYFDNITNTELNKYPKPYINNFSIKLSDILHQTNGAFDNGLFRIEEVITDKAYRIYPLFNTRIIQSTNPDDRIFDNRLIIATVQEDETYITFISDESQDIQDYSNYATYYDIGDTLTTNQYNSIVSLMRAFGGFRDEIIIDETSTVTGFGTYDFKVTGNILDIGIELTDLTEDLQCKLSGQVLEYSTYTLKLNALRIDNTNIDTETDNRTIIPVTVELENNTYVDIPVDDLETGDILLYDAVVEITNDKPIIVWPEGE